jgi:tetratricopeptide (TPR) repeat protein
VLLAVCIAERSSTREEIAPAKPHQAWLAVAGMAAIMIAVVIFAVRPVARMNRSLNLARAAGQRLAAGPLAGQPADRLYREAIAADPLDPTPGVARSRWLLAVSSLPQFREEALAAAVGALEEAIERDPFKVGLRRQLMQLYRAKAEHTGRAADYQAAVSAASAALELYPLDPSGIVSLGDCQKQAGEATGSDELLRQAAETYQQALDLDASRPDWERIRGFRDRERDAIRAKIRDIQGSKDEG